MAVVHIPGYGAAHTGHGLGLLTRLGFRRSAPGCGGEDVGGEDAPALVWDVLQLEAELGRGLGGERAGLGAGLCGRRGRRSLELFDALLRYPAAGAGAGHLGQLHAELPCELLGRRRGHDPAGGRLRRRSGLGRGRLRTGRRPGLRRAGQERGNVLARLTYDGHAGQAGQGLSLLRQYLQKCARGRGLYGVRELVGLDLEERLAFPDGLALGLEPAADRALRHREAELRHHYEFCHLHFLLIRPEHAQSRGLA